MIKLKIEKYRDFTEEEKKAREEFKRKSNNYYPNNYDTLTPAGVEKYYEKWMEVELTDDQWKAIKKEVLKVFE